MSDVLIGQEITINGRTWIVSRWFHTTDRLRLVPKTNEWVDVPAQAIHSLFHATSHPERSCQG